MAPVSKKTIYHFTHPDHPLAELCAGTEYLCNGCHTPGGGTRYSCQSCNFNLHDYCASCPTSLSSFMHPHPLTLVAGHPHGERLCNLCGNLALGLFYRCKNCEFDIHPLCTQLPELLRHVLDSAHPLSLQQPSSVPACCAVCGAHCNTSWRYSCGVCGLHIHVDCVLAPCGPSTGQRSFPPPQPPPPPSPPYGPFAYGYGASHAYTPYSNVYGYHVNYNQPPQPQPPLGLPSGGNYGYGYGPYGYGVPLHHAYTPYTMYHDNVNYYQPQPQPQLQAQGGGATNGRVGQRMFALVGSLAMGVLSNVIFGMIN